jgi:hypothetical protein
MLPASGGGNIVAMSGGGVAQHDPLSSKVVRQQGSGAGLVFANGGGCSSAIPSNGGGCSSAIPSNGGGPLKQRKQRGGIDKPTIAVRGLPKSDPNNIDDILQKLTENPSMVKKDTYTLQEQDTILKNLLKNVTTLKNSKADIYTVDVGIVKSTD